MKAYEKFEKYDDEKIESLSNHYKIIIDGLGEDVKREGLERTPERVAHCLESPGCEVAVMSPGSSSDSGACISRVAHKAPLFSTPPGYTPLPWDQNNST